MGVLQVHGRDGWKTLLAAGVLAVGVATFAAKAAPWEVSGAHFLSADELAALLDPIQNVGGSPEAAEEAIQRLLARYWQAGYLFAEVTAQPRPEGGWNLVVQEGPRARLNQWRAVGVREFSADELHSLLGLRPGMVFDEKRLQAAWERLVRRYAERGYPFVEVQPTVAAVDPQTGAVDFLLRVEEGPRAVVERIQIEGLQKTRPEVVRRLIPFREGEPFDIRKIEAARRRLLRSGLFAALHPSDLKRGEKPNGVVYRVRVQETPSFRVAGLLGYAPPTMTADVPQLTGYLELSERNLFGTARAFQWRWESTARRLSLFRYREPFLFGSRLAVDFDFQAERVDRVVHERWGLQAYWPATEVLTLGLGGRWLRGAAGHGYGLVLSGLYDSRDRPFFPRRGSTVAVQAETFGGEFRFHRFQADLGRYQQVGRRTVLLLRARGGTMGGPRVPSVEWFYLGGSRMLRGYRERTFPGLAYLLGTAELRRELGRRAYGFLFLDVGGVRPKDVWIGPRFGYGVGVLVESKGGLLRIQYALQPEASALDGKIHLQLGTEF